MLGPSTERDAAPAALRRPALQAILDAGLETFAATGFHGASVRDIARAAETSLSNLYNYFPSKEDLLVAVLKDANKELRAQVDEAIHAAPAVATQWQQSEHMSGLLSITKRPRSFRLPRFDT